MRFSREIKIEPNTIPINQKIKYWKTRGFKFQLNDNGFSEGKRGNLLGNLTAFNMKRIMATVIIYEKDSETLSVVLDVNTIFQILTKTNIEFFELELETFERSLLSNDELDEKWISHQKRDRYTNIKWILGFAALGFVIGVIVSLPLFFH